MEARRILGQEPSRLGWNQTDSTDSRLTASGKHATTGTILNFNPNPGLIMRGNIGLWLICIIPVACFAPGCKPKPSEEPTTPAAYFQTPFQTESQFIVEAIVSDLAEQMFYAASHRLPDAKHFSVTATENPGAPPDAPVYKVRIRLDPKHNEQTFDLNINGPIWSPAIYRTVAEPLARALGLSAPAPHNSDDASLLSRLADCSPETIEEENQELSAALEKDFSNPVLHEKAALLLGAFLLRDHSGRFFEIRSPLSRMTAHLATARFLRGANDYGINGQLADTIILVLLNNSAPAQERLNAFGTNNAPLAAMVRALQAYNTGDYRPLDRLEDRSQLENVEWFIARAACLDCSSSWPKLSEPQQQTIDFVRIANHVGYSVEIGHQLFQLSLPLEMREINALYELSHREKLAPRRLVDSLNELPERCFNLESGGKVRVRVIGWGQWANFLQRHLCHAVQQNFVFLNSKLGVPDDAKEFAAKCERQFGGLRLYPFVRRFNCTTVEAYHKSVDDGFKVTVATPHLVPALCWNQLCYKVSFAPLYNPNPNPHINEWHNHNPPPGTVYDLAPRLNHPSLINRPDAIARFEKLLELAPLRLPNRGLHPEEKIQG